MTTLYQTEFKQRFPELSYLMGYFNQDWGYIFDWQGGEPDFRAVVRHFKAVDPHETVVQATLELERFLALSLGEEEMRRALHEMDSAYYPPGDG